MINEHLGSGLRFTGVPEVLCKCVIYHYRHQRLATKLHMEVKFQTSLLFTGARTILVLSNSFFFFSLTLLSKLFLPENFNLEWDSL